MNLLPLFLSSLSDVTRAVVMPFRALCVVGLTGSINAMTHHGVWWLKWVALGLGVAVLVSAALKLLLAISGTFIYALTLSTIIRLTYFALTCAALPVLRRRFPARPAPFRVAGGTGVAMVCIALCGWLLLSSTGTEARDVAVAAVAGLGLYFFFRKKKRLVNRV